MSVDHKIQNMMKDLLLQHSRVLRYQLCSGEQWDMVTTHLWWLFVSEQLMRELEKDCLEPNSIHYCEGGSARTIPLTTHEEDVN